MISERQEWLETDGLGGFAMGTTLGVRTRRYHALLLHATTPPTGRFTLVNGLDAWVDTPRGTFAITAQRYADDVIHPDRGERPTLFEPEPWPRWTFVLPDDTRLIHELFMPAGLPVVALTWRLLNSRRDVSLSVRPFLSGRDYHALHRENPDFRFQPRIDGGRLVWQPYDGVPSICTVTNGHYFHEPYWYRQFLYEEERARGQEFLEDLAAPGVFRFALSEREAVLLCAANGAGQALPTDQTADALLEALRTRERARRSTFASPIERAADQYLVRRGGGRTIIAGYPWFADWGRDTFIALRGLCLATGRLDEAREILLEWAGAVSDGMLPNRFPDRGDTPEYNAVDASLWFIIVADDWRRAMERAGRAVTTADARELDAAIEAILAGYARGTRYGIRLDDDGLLAAGAPGAQLTWMDAKVADWVVTPRCGKPVEVQALWLSALAIGGRGQERWNELRRRGQATFAERFWNDERGCLYDVIDVNHQPGRDDPAVRPNQIFAVGGLPEMLLNPVAARQVVDVVERRLWTPVGLRTLAPEEPEFAPRYEGNAWTRDGAYHQGTAWPWLLGPFIEAWVRVRGGSRQVRQEARARFLEPLERHLPEAGIGHISEIADGDMPHTPRGCPFQAWSVGEYLRLSRFLVA